MQKSKKMFLASIAGEVADEIAKEALPVKKNLLFINTAAEVYGGNPDWLEADRNALKKVGFNVRDYSITGRNAKDLEEELKKQDVVFVSGGNVYYLLEKIQQSNTKNVFKKFVEAGMPYIGSSAGSVVAGPTVKPVEKIDDVKKAPNLSGFIALGLIDFTVMPHWGSEGDLDDYIETMQINYFEENKLILLTNTQYVYVHGDMYKIIDVRDG